MSIHSEAKYSLWLLPEATIQAQLNAQIKSLSTRFNNSPLFEAHITLWSPIFGNLESILQEMLLMLSEFEGPFENTISGLECGGSFYRALYYKLNLNPKLQQLYTLATNSVSFDECPLFMPHISLVYTEESIKPIPDLAQFPSFTIDRLALVETSAPIENWKIVETLAF